MLGSEGLVAMAVLQVCRLGCGIEGMAAQRAANAGRSGSGGTWRRHAGTAALVAWV